MILDKEPLVRKILTENIDARDDDGQLVARYWRQQLWNLGYKQNLSDLSALGLLKLIYNNKLASADYITRTRRKIQEKDPSLRGEKWDNRHKDTPSSPQGAVKGELNSWPVYDKEITQCPLCGGDDVRKFNFNNICNECDNRWRQAVELVE